MEGEALGEIIDALITEHQAELLAAEGAVMTRSSTRRHDRRAGAPRAGGRLPPGRHWIRPSSTRACWSATRSASTTPRLTIDSDRSARRRRARRRSPRWPRGGSAREPVARILGVKEFWGLPLRLNDATLVPRPETETVVEAALAAIDGDGPRTRALRIADLGTGSGALLLALLCASCRTRSASAPTSAARRSRPRATMPAASALPRARHSSPAISARRSRGRFDLVVSNPPYIASAEIAALRARGARTIRAARSTAAPTASAAIARLRPTGAEPAQADGPSGGRARRRPGTRPLRALFRAAGLVAAPAASRSFGHPAGACMRAVATMTP